MSELATHSDESKTWMLFESGIGVEVDLSLYSPPGERGRPIDAYVVTECEGGFTGSARRAAETVYHVLKKHGSEIEPVVVGYDLQGLPAGVPVTGESGGLAFAIALARRILGQNPGPVAATGEIRSSHGDGSVGPVNGIPAKLRAAGRLVPEKSRVLYPEANDPDIPDDLRRSLTEKGLVLHPVSSVKDALELLFEFPAAPRKGTVIRRGTRPFRSGLLVAILILAAALLLAKIHGWPPFGAGMPEVRTTVPFELAPSTVIHGSDRLTHRPQVATSSPQPALGRKEGPAIQLKGEDGIAAEVARLATEQVEKLFGHKGYSGDARVRGRVAVLDIMEAPFLDTGELFSRMTVGVRGLTVQIGKAFRASRKVRITVRGQGNARALIPKAASALAKEIAYRSPVQNGRPAGKKPEPRFD